MTTDTSTRFLFSDADVRGNLISLNESYRQVVDVHAYPAALQQRVGEFLAGVLLLSETIKFKGRIVLQARTDGPIRLIVAEANHQRQVRAVARLDESQAFTGDFPVLFYGGTLAVIIEPENGESYQSLVPLQGDSLASCLEHYFTQSEQLNTFIRLKADDTSASGFLLQQLPAQRVLGKSEREGQWQHLSMLARTVTGEEIKSLPHTDVVKRLFAQETVEVYTPHSIESVCSCNEGRLANSLVALGQQELDELFTENPVLTLTCEFCLTEYKFDAAYLTELVRGDSESH